MPFDPARLPDSLKQAYREKRCAVLVGAGASAGAGLPLWGGLLDQMIHEAEVRRVIPAEKAVEYRALRKDTSKFLMIAAGLKDDIRQYFDEFIEKTFISPKPQPTEMPKALVRADRFQFR